MMLKAVFATVFLTGLLALGCQAQAKVACPKAAAYARMTDQALSKVSDKDLGAAIRCLARKLPVNAAHATPADVGTVGHIQRFAAKIIGNGKQMAYAPTPVQPASATGTIIAPRSIGDGKTVALETPAPIRNADQVEVASKIIGNGKQPDPTPADVSTDSQTLEPTPTLSKNVQNATAISCEADKMLEKMHPAKVVSPECATAAGTRDAIARYASKIIGNG